MARRALAVAGAVGMTLLATSGPALADPPSASWTAPTAGAVAVPGDQAIRLEGAAIHTGDVPDPPGFTGVTFSVVTPGGGCDPSPVRQVFDSNPSVATVPFIYEATFPCNGNYAVTATLETALSGSVSTSVSFTRSIPAPDPEPDPAPPPAGGTPPASTTPSTAGQGSGRTRIGRGVAPAPPTTTGDAEAQALSFDAAESRTTTTTADGDLPEDDAAVVAQIEDGDGGDDDARDIAVPVAGGLALLVGAFNLRYVAKRAKEAAEADAAREIPPF